MDDLIDRLDRLERSNRRLKGAVALLAIAFVSLVGVGWKPPDGNVQAGEFAVTSWRDNKVARLGVYDDGIGLTVYTPSKPANALHHPHVDLVTDSKGAHLSFTDMDGKTRATLGMSQEDGIPNLTLCDANGKARVVLDTARNGDPKLQLLDADGHTIWSAPTK